jgi:CheY-like chemotaxis protein
LSDPASKILVLTSQSGTNDGLVAHLRSAAAVTEVATIDEAVEALRKDYYDAIFSDTSDFLPLERALVKQQASLILNTIGEGVCIVDSAGHCTWSNRRMQSWPGRIHEKIRRTCFEAFEQFTKTGSSVTPYADPASPARSKRFDINIDNQQFFELTASPVINPAGQVVQIVAVIWDSTSSRRLQQQLDAIDRAGRELMRLEVEAIDKMQFADRLKLLQDKIVRATRELLRFDHFVIRVLNHETKKLELTICHGLPEEAKAIELYAAHENNGICGYVAATGRSYICPDVESDPRYVLGLDKAMSSLTVPLFLYDDKVIGVFNIESDQKAAFTEDHRQIVEIFGRYVAIALNTFNLLVKERAAVRHNVADDVCGEVAGPLNDLCSDVRELMDAHVAEEELSGKLRRILDYAEFVRRRLRPVAEGIHTVLGADELQGQHEPLLADMRILVADDDQVNRVTIADILRKFRCIITEAASGSQAIDLINGQQFDLVLSDIHMPDKNGYDVFNAARHRRRDLPVILMTGFGYDASHSIYRSSQEGLQAVLFKPFRAHTLIDEVRKAFSPSGQK